MPDDAQQLELSRGIAARAGREDERPLVLPGGGEYFAVDADNADGGVHDALAVAAAYDVVMALP
jgi:hypothetical protein